MLITCLVVWRASVMSRGYPGADQPLLRRPVAIVFNVSWMPLLDTLVVVARAVAAEQFDLHHVQRIEVREPVADAAGERRIVGEQVVRAGQPRVPPRARS